MLPQSDASEISDENMSNADNDIPQWKKELIARLRSQNKRTATAGRQEQQLCSQRPSAQLGRSVQQPGALEAVASGEKCKAMVQERCWNWAPEPNELNGACDPEEDLHYGPGIVNKLRERYLSLAQRETTKTRPTILRKATSLENILDDAPAPNNAEPARLFQTRLNGNAADPRNAPNRYRNKRGPELKRARSVEAISTSDEPEETKPKRESMHEEMLIKEGSDKPKIIEMLENAEPKSFRINRPKRIAPVMNEKEKPPADVVKDTKRFFERRPEQRTKPPAHTGDVAAKVATFKNIIVQQKPAKKPALKAKPAVSEKPKVNGARIKNKPADKVIPKTCPEALPSLDVPPAVKSPESLPSPIPDVSRIDFKSGDECGSKSTSLSETPDLLITSTPLPVLHSQKFTIAATELFIKEEIKLAANDRTKSPQIPEDKHSVIIAKINNQATKQRPANTHTPPTQPLKVEINGFEDKKKDNENRSPTKTKSTLTTLEIEKNLINTAKTLEQPKSSIKSVEEVTLVKVVKVKKALPELTNTSIVFDFRDRQDVPDYVHNDGITRTAVREKPKVGEGGITLLPGFSHDEDEEDEELLRSLECPPSPCDVMFINDNILIDGKSSLSQKTKKAKMKISFVDGPDVFEYPSESSLLIEEVQQTSPIAQIRTVPSLGGSTLANYTPKSTEEFQPGVSRSVQNAPSKIENRDVSDCVPQEVEKPIMFSSRTNTDILF